MIDVCKLNTGEIMQLIADNQRVQFAKGRWSLIGELNKRPRKQEIRWVKACRIAKKWSVR